MPLLCIVIFAMEQAIMFTQQTFLQNSGLNVHIYPVLLSAILVFAPVSSFADDFNNSDMPGGDFKNFNLTNPRWEDCKAACGSNMNCFAWTYVKPGIQGPTARCWLKNTRPNRVKNTCCISGTR